MVCDKKKIYLHDVHELMGLLLDLFGTIVILLIPIISLIMLYVIYEEFRPLALKIHMNRNILSSLVIGCVFGLGAVPLIAWEKSWLMMNMAGAIIPTVLSIYFWYRNRLNPLFVIGGVLLVAFMSFKVTRIIPGMGIGAEFPDFLLPMVVTSVYSGLYAIWKGKEQILPMSFTIGCLGTLIGADLIRIPYLISKMQMEGSIGGARTLDLVLVSPLASFLFSFFLICLASGFSRKRLLRGLKNEPETALSNDKRWISIYSAGYEKLKRGKHRNAVVLSLWAVREKMRIVAGLRGYFGAIFRKKNISDMIFEHHQPVQDYHALERNSRKKDISAKEAYNSLVTSQLLLELLEYRRKNIIASLPRRIGAYLIDQVFILLISGIILGLWIIPLTLPERVVGNNELVIPPYIYYMIFFYSIWGALQLPYFYFFEYYWMKTPGKRLLGIEVMEMGREKPSMEAVLARNIGRYFDLVVGLFVFSLIFMVFSRNRQRIGDLVADTVVVRKL